MKLFPMVASAMLLATAAQGAQPDPAAGRLLAAEVCVACHGANGVSVSADIPHLAGQRAAYLVRQLEAFKAGTRKNDLMGAIAPQLSATQMADVAAYFASQTGAAVDAKSTVPARFVASHVPPPPDLGVGYVRYLTRNFPEQNSVSYYYANAVAMAAAARAEPLPDGAQIYVENYSARLDAAGKPVIGADGSFVGDQLRSYTGMARAAGWGEQLPAMVRNDNWNYAVFNADRSVRTDINYTECLACHKPQAPKSFLFMYDKLVDAARTARH